MSYLIDGIRHCDLKWSFFSADYDAKKCVRKSMVESGGQAVDSSSIWGQKKISQIDWNVIKTILNYKKAFQYDFYGVVGQKEVSKFDLWLAQRLK